MRTFALVALDLDNSITDRFPLDMITGLGGLGWKLKLSTLSGDVADVITKVVQEKQDVSLTINFLGRSYDKYLLLSQWVQKYSLPDKRLALEYNDGVKLRYVEGKLTELKKADRDEYGNLACAARFTPQTPFFTDIKNSIRIEYSSKGKSYPFKYPYCYGIVKVENNEIDNPYIADVPITVTIYGSVTHPYITLLDERGNAYNTVSFPDLILTDGQYLIINSSTRKIYFFDGNKIQDYSAKTDPKHDTFLLAQNGVSTIVSNIQATDTGYIVGSWRQYSL